MESQPQNPDLRNNPENFHPSSSNVQLLSDKQQKYQHLEADFLKILKTFTHVLCSFSFSS